MNSERRTPPWWFSVISHKIWRGGKVVYKDWINVTLITRIEVRSFGDIFRLKSLTWHLVLCPLPPRLGICQIFHTSIFQKFSILPETKRANRGIFGQNLKLQDVLLTYFEQIVSFCAFTYSKTNSLKLFYENSSLNSTNFTDRVCLR